MILKLLMFFDTDTFYKGVIGFMITITLPGLDTINEWVRVIGGICGLVLLFLSIRRTYFEMKNEQNKLNKK